MTNQILTQLAASYSSYSYSYPSSSYSNDAIVGGIFALGVGFMIFLILLLLASYAIISFLMMKTYKKFGVEAWKAWVPFVQQWTMLELGGFAGWWIFVPVANFIVPILAAYNIGLKLGKSQAFVALYFFVPLVWWILMSLESSRVTATPQASLVTFGPAPTGVFAPVNQAPVAPAPAPQAPVAPAQAPVAPAPQAPTTPDQTNTTPPQN